MLKRLLFITITLFLLISYGFSQPCQITQVTATPLPCSALTFMVSVNLQVTNPTSPGFTLAGNGVIYGTWLYSDLPVTVGPFLGDELSSYEFIAWDVQNPDCQNFVSITAANCGPICDFSKFKMQKISCVTNNIAAVTIDFKHSNTAGVTFDLFYATGTLVTTALYTSLPYDILNFTANGADSIRVKVCDHSNPTCCENFTLPPIDCNPTNCEIYNLSIDPECLTGNFVVHLDFDVAHPASDSFTIHGNTLTYGTFGYNELPIVLGPLNGNTNINWDFIIQDKVMPSCTKDALLGIYHCPPPCNILSFNATPTLCNGNDAYALRLDMDIEGKGHQGYSIFSESHYYGTHPYNELPYTVPAFAGSGNFVDQVTVCDNENPGCCTTKAYEALLCAGCIIYNLEANPLPCDNNGNFFISIDFDHQNTSTEGFSITGNGMQFGNFSYSQVPLLLGPFNGNVDQFFEFVVTDLGNEFCFDATEIGTLACNTICSLSNLQAETGECTANNAYILHVNFDHTGTLGTGFKLSANGQYFDTYNYSDLPLTILEFPSSGDGNDMIQVCDLNNSNCCTSLTFNSPDCHCSIFDITAENLGCTSDTTFAISVEFFGDNLLDNSVDVTLDGVLLGTFDVSSVPFVVANVPEGTSTAILTICGHTESGCCASIPIQLVNCEGPQCSIFNLNANIGACNTDTTYFVDIVFDTANLQIDSVIIAANGHPFGNFKVQPNFIRILNFPEFDEPTTTITVTAVGNNLCHDTYSYTTPDCTPNDCEVSELVAFSGPCASDTTYELVIEYLTENFAVDSVTVSANGILLDTIFDPDHHIVIPDFPVFPDSLTTVRICSFYSPGCCDTYQFVTPNCVGTEVCNISNLTADAGSCQPDSTYLLALNFQQAHLSIDSVIITANGNNMGTFQVQGGHIVFDHFPVFPSPSTTIHLCGAGDPECCVDVTFDTPHCNDPEDCGISDLQIHVGDCLTDSTYVLFVDFKYRHLPVDSVILTSSEGIIGQFAVNEGHITLNSFQTIPGDPVTIHVCAVGSADCCAQDQFFTPNCIGGGTCHIYELTATPGPCDSLTYPLDIDFWWNNLPTDSVQIYANNLFIGTYHTDPGVIHIPEFPLVGGDSTTLEVCALGSPDCCASFAYVNPCINHVCSIFDISVQTFACNSDSTFGAIINFQYQNVTAIGFDVYTGNQNLGFYTFNQIPIIVNQFHSNTSGEYAITICEHDNFNCCSNFEFEGPVCGPHPCDISTLEYSLSPCDSAGNFFFILNFQYQEVGDSGFNVVGNGNIYGNFSYDQLPVEIGPFPSDNTSFEFLVTDADNQACFGYIQPGAVECKIDTVATTNVDRDEIFQILNNGSLPIVLAKKDFYLSLYNSTGKLIDYREKISSGSLFEINSLPSGFYFAFISYQGNTWPVKLVKGSY
ncbi:MAG: hypothetical protein WBP41_05905 [Saprospiraceae bacterium]